MSNVVIIDFKSDGFQDLVGMVRDCNYNVRVASDFKSALKIISNSRVQILVLEWQQSSEYARVLIESIRNNHRFRRIHIIAISVNSTPELVADALNSQVNDFFSWPISIGEIRRRFLWASNEQELLV